MRAQLAHELQPSEQKIARDQSARQLLPIRRQKLRLRAQIAIAQHHEERQMLRREHLHRAQKIVSLFAFGKDGHDQDERAMAQPVSQDTREREVVGVLIGSPQLRRVRGDRAQLPRSATGRQTFVDVGVERQDADFVLHAIADVADEDRRVHGMIESRDLFDARRHPMSLIETQQDLLRSIESKFADDQPAVAGGRAPGDVAVIVVVDVVAQAVEIAPLADARRCACA